MAADRIQSREPLLLPRVTRLREALLAETTPGDAPHAEVIATAEQDDEDEYWGQWDSWNSWTKVLN